jgi:shikimate kinase
MPGAGKSTLGIILAKEKALDFVDTDVLIQVREGKTLQDILDSTDYLNLRAIEEQTLLSVDLSHHIIATGGSAVYSQKGMEHLQTLGPIVFLNCSLQELRRRIHNYESRGIARRPDQSFEALFEERSVLYRRYANHVIECDGKNQETILAEIMERI